MMLSNFIRRNGKRKAPKGKTSDLTSVPTSSSDVLSPRVFNIGDPTLDLDEAGSSISIIDPSPLVHLDLPSASEEWFPQELLQGRANSRASLVDSRDTATPTSDNLTLVIGQHSQSSSSSEQTPLAEDVRPGHHVRKKSVPAPIIIPDVDRLLPSAQTGHPAPLSSALLTKSAPQNGEAASNLPLSSSSENLSAVSGTTLARALIANSFVLSSVENRKSRHRSGMTRQDSATLPRGSISSFSPEHRDRHTSGAQSTSSSEPARPSSIPPVPPLPMGPFLHSNYTPGLTSGSSTSSEYPISDAYALSPVTNHAGRRVSRIQEVATPSTPTMSATLPPLQSTSFAVNDSPQTHRNSTSDVPNTASDLSSPLDSRRGESSQAESFILSSADHTLDEFDFVPLGPQSMMVSPGSESSASYIAPRRDISRRQRKRRGGGLNIVTSTPKDDIATDSTLVSPRGNAIPSAVSDIGYGELLNYPVTVNPDVTPSWSTTSVSAGYQTFPETPALFTPLVSGGLSGFTSNNQWPKSASGKLSHHGTLVNRHMAGKNDSLGVLQRPRTTTALLSIQKTPLPPMPERPNTSPSPHLSQKEAIVEEPQEPEETEETEETGEIEETVETKLRPHPLAHISTSSSNLQAEEALQAFARHSCSSLPSAMMYPDHASSSPPEYARLIPLPDSTTTSPVSLRLTMSVVSTPPSTSTPSESISQSQPQPQQHQQHSSLGSSFLPSPSSLSPSPLASPREHCSGTTSPAPHAPPSRASSEHSVSPSYIAPPPYHIVVSERTQHHRPSAYPESQPPLSRPSLSRPPSTDTVYERIREASTSTAPDARSRTRARSRPRLPGGPRKPSGVTQPPLGSFVPGVTTRNGSVTSVATPERGSSPNASSSPWPKLYAAASNPPPKFHTPAPKWRGLTMEAAQWTFTSDELQSIVSRAIQSSSEGSSIRLLRLETLDGEIADETHRLEMQRTDVKAQYKALVRKRWTLMGALAGHIEGVEMNDTATAIQTMEELAEVSLALDHLAEKLHDIIEQLAQLKSLREVHNGSALAMALRKMHHSFFRQMAEREQLVEQICDLQTERDEAWKHAEKVAKDWDELNDRLMETTGGGEVQSPVNDEAISFQSNQCSARLSALRKSSVRRSQAGLRSRKPRSRRSSFSATTNGGPSAPSAGEVPPVPRVPRVPPLPLPLNSRANTMLTAALSSSGPLSTTASFYSSASVRDSTDMWALAQAQRDVYDMLGISIPSSVASPRPRTISGPHNLLHASRPVSDLATGGLKSRVKGRRATEDGNRAIRSVIFDDR